MNKSDILYHIQQLETMRKDEYCPVLKAQTVTAKPILLYIDEIDILLKALKEKLEK